jgi:hypothetical protein
VDDKSYAVDFKGGHSFGEGQPAKKAGSRSDKKSIKLITLQVGV